MSYDGISALTPTRPPPPAPRRGPSDSSMNNTPIYSSASSFTSYNSAASNASSYHTAYSAGIGGSPDRGHPSTSSGNGPPVRQGYVSVKEDGFASWLWSKKWLVLREEVLSIHRSEVRYTSVLLSTPSFLSLTICLNALHRLRHRLAQSG